ncbi:zinc-binding metallopeptidase family protein [Aureimonas jatrophae]|uniref:Zinc-ribbon domain-containing protein n=1 Tax=Aureimonas jatrophae TaxID=1166073 RepID=A0A1H0HLK9_9HYPH|nr:putative zinc-binding peptidase [Aureimonas jatrophae]MBB3950659.1 hypothetical protein [Aureimonas jatrophae]SDO20098.1 hypothetical protein SAMN05192530_104167 [Aureimonas jatrophae]
MKLFSCPACDQVVFFDNIRCERCGHTLGYEPRGNRMLALEVDGDAFVSVERGGQRADRWRYCDNHRYGVCNWLIPAESADLLCLADRHNLMVPDLSDPANQALWGKMEAAKHRMFYTLLRLKLPLWTRAEHPEGLGFKFLADDPAAGVKVMTGHDEGIVTVALAEADDVERETRRNAMGEPYRTLLGHFRHEVGHWYWDMLVRDGGALDACRAIFGDDRIDYGQALQAHYANGPKPGWQEEYVSSYAGSHPWEDFAETWAHYLHIVDTLEVGGSYGMTIHPRLDRDGILTTELDFKVYDAATTIEEIADAWLALSQALNSMNRAMGLSDLYPFVLSRTVIRKLGFIHDLVHGRVGNAVTAAETPAAPGAVAA